MLLNLPPLRIANLTVDFPVLLAPMAGYTDSAFRSICRRYHCGLAYTELVNAQALVFGSKAAFFLLARIFHTPGRACEVSGLEADPGERPLGAHIYGSDPSILARAAVLVEKLNRFDLIDLNCGCPMRKVARRGAGAGLMDHPEKVHAIIRAIRQTVSLPVTAKIRLGRSPSRPTASEVAQAAEEAGAAAVAIHARFAADKHKGPPDWEAIARVKSERGIPIIGNGGVMNVRDAVHMRAQTGADGIMVGRGALGNPWVFQEVRAYFAGQAWAPPSLAERRAVILEHLARLCRLKTRDPRYATSRQPRLSPEVAAVMLFRAHLLKYLAGFPGAGAIRAGLNAMCAHADVERALDAVLG
ncbi:MAG: tRNA-dihydrouridine synthase family protein [Verrucomicrobiota bacterium]|nr:tRNA-dihydrouridine synthase family protein [Verrucomicrobiota bacterium]